MTLHEYRDLEQRSDEWLSLRCGIVTASVAGKLITPKTCQPASNETTRDLAALLAAERITGHADATYQSFDMFRGVIEEPRAREHYSEHHAPVTECGFMVLEESWGRLGYSPDGLVGDDGLIEIKAPRAKNHLQTILAEEVPAEHMPQLQAGLLVSGREWIDFVSWCGGMPMFVCRIEPDPRWFEAIAAAIEAFEVDVWAMVHRYKRATKGLPMTERLDLAEEEVELKLA